MTKRVQTDLEVDGNVTTGGQSVLSETDMTKAQASNIRSNPKITVGSTEPSTPSNGDVWLDTS